MDRAKMDILVSYAINDLIWGKLMISSDMRNRADGSVYLKMKGVDPATHEVSAELVCAPFSIQKAADEKERIRTYYGKVKRVEEPESRMLFLGCCRQTLELTHRP
jgi:exosome complex protein LRP1